MKTDEQLKQIAVRIYWFVQHDQINEAVDELKTVQGQNAGDVCKICGGLDPCEKICIHCLNHFKTQQFDDHSGKPTRVARCDKCGSLFDYRYKYSTQKYRCVCSTCWAFEVSLTSHP